MCVHNYIRPVKKEKQNLCCKAPCDSCRFHLLQRTALHLCTRGWLWTTLIFGSWPVGVGGGHDCAHASGLWPGSGDLAGQWVESAFFISKWLLQLPGTAAHEEILIQHLHTVPWMRAIYPCCCLTLLYPDADCSSSSNLLVG